MSEPERLWCYRCEKHFNPNDDGTGYLEEYVMTTDWMFGRRTFHLMCHDKQSRENQKLRELLEKEDPNAYVLVKSVLEECKK